MSFVVSITRTCPECHHAKHEGRVCNAVGGLGVCRCSPYEWVDISDWQEEVKKEEVKKEASIAGATRAERLYDYLFPLEGLGRWKVTIIVVSIFSSQLVSVT
jgi:hypothetical protein